MTREYDLFTTIEQVPLQEWNALCQARPSCYMGPHFLRAIETTLPDQARVFHTLIYEADGTPGACASLCLYPVDLLLLAGPGVRDRVTWIRKLIPRFGQTKILMCGLPFSAGQSHLAFAAGCDRPRALKLLDQLLQELARREEASAIVFKEFGAEDCPDLDGLCRLGYWRADSPPMYELAKPFTSFADYCSALKAHYRSNVRRSQRKFEESGCRVVRLYDPDAIAQVYTPEVHALYEAVVAKSDLKFEVLSREFFLELVRHLPGCVHLTVVYRGERIVGFTWMLACGLESHFLFMGLDHGQNAAADLYFNMVYQSFDLAFRSGAEIVHVGQTADAFKALLGCTGKPRYLYARGLGLVLPWILRKCAGLLFPPRPPLPAHDVFKQEETPAPRKPKARKQKAVARATAAG
jgi:predicted N-acyltransferase